MFIAEVLILATGGESVIKGYSGFQWLCPLSSWRDFNLLRSSQKQQNLHGFMIIKKKQVCIKLTILEINN